MKNSNSTDLVYEKKIDINKLEFLTLLLLS